MKRMILLLLTILFARGYAIERDNQLWLYLLYERPLVEKWRFSIFGEGRFGNDASKLYHKVIEMAGIYECNKWIEISPGFRNIWNTARNGPRIREEVHIPFIALFTQTERIANRFRPEYVVRERGKNTWLIREQLTWFFPVIQPKKMKLEAYLQDEIFWSDDFGFFENRVTLGGDIPLKGPFELGIFFLYRFLKLERDWEHDKVLGIQLNYIFQE